MGFDSNEALRDSFGAAEFDTEQIQAAEQSTFGRVLTHRQWAQPVDEDGLPLGDPVLMPAAPPAALRRDRWAQHRLLALAAARRFRDGRAALALLIALTHRDELAASCRHGLDLVTRRRRPTGSERGPAGRQAQLLTRTVRPPRGPSRSLVLTPSAGAAA
jgi:hypothetical protein